jgi:hypothetical protein
MARLAAFLLVPSPINVLPYFLRDLYAWVSHTPNLNVDAGAKE